MKKSCLLIFLSAVTSACFAQAINWQWAKGGGGPGIGEGINVATDASGSVYLAGEAYNNYVTFGADTFVPYSLFPVLYLTKYDSAGNVLWVRNQYLANSTYGGGAYDVTTDTKNNVYITGFCTGTSALGHDTLRGPNTPHLLTAKYNSSGQVQWAKSNGPGYVTAYGVATDAMQNVFVTGYFTDTLVFGNSVLVTGGNATVFIAKYDSAGNELWAKAAPADNACQSNAIITDGAGYSTITGSFWCDSIKFGSTALYNFSHTGSFADIFVARYDPNGQLTWAKSYGGDSGDDAYGIAADKNGNFYITGYFASDSMTFDSITLYSPARETRLFVVKYNTAGKVIWAKASTGVINVVQGYNLSIDSNSNVYVCGSFSSGATFSFDSTALTSPQTVDPMFILTLDSNGNVLCSTALGSGGDDESGIAVDRFGNAYVGGDFEIANLPVGSDTLTLTSTDETTFVAKFNCGAVHVCNLAPPVLTIGNSSICAGDSSQICAPNGYSSYVWNSGQTTPCFYSNQAGSYFVGVTYGNNCQSFSAPVSLTVDTPAQINIQVSHDTLSVAGGTNIQWFLNGNPIPGDTSALIVYTKSGIYTVQEANLNGCTTLSNPLAISDIKFLNTDAVTIYPNPSTGSWHLTCPTNLAGMPYTVYDSKGAIIYQSIITTTQSEIDLNVPDGIYFLRMQGTDGVYTKKLVKL